VYLAVVHSSEAVSYLETQMMLLLNLNCDQTIGRLLSFFALHFASQRIPRYIEGLKIAFVASPVFREKVI